MLAPLLFVLVAVAAPAPICTTVLPGEGDRHAGLDLDGDAIPDSEDWCALTPAGARVGPNGCADWEIPVACERDAPVPPPRAPVAADPVAAAEPARDSDGDGVNDAADQCADTPAGLAVDAKGCVEIEKVVLSGVNFAMGSATLVPGASGTLRTVAQAMKASPAVEVEVGGHTDSIGPADKNQRLSERRANAVRQFLVGEGVDAARVTAKGYGETQPVESNETDAGRANNRRVAFRLTKQ
jgi:OOP family OmpA-OmpF porin